MIDRREILVKAWARYRAAYGNYNRFFREAFAYALKLEWQVVRFAREKAAEQARRDREYAERAAARPVRFMGEIIERPMTAMEAAIDATKYLPAHMSQSRAIEDIRARYAAAA